MIPENIIVHFLQKTISREEEEILNEWLREDDRNNELFCQLLEIWDAEQWMKEEKILRNWHKLQQRLATTPRNRIRPIRQWLRYAAAAAVLIGVIWGVTFTMQQEKNEQCFVSNRNDEVQRLVLPDNSIVWLHKDSRIVYPSQFTKNRHIVLEGIAYFEVQKDKKNPFVVQADNSKITVTGTAFEVDLTSRNNILVTLVSGGVNIDSESPGQSIRSNAQLSPGEQAVINRESGNISIQNVDVHYYAEWKDGSYRYENETLENIAKQLSFNYGIEISVDPNLKNKRFSGEILSPYSIEQVLELITAGHPMEHKIIRDSIIYLK